MQTLIIVEREELSLSLEARERELRRQYEADTRLQAAHNRKPIAMTMRVLQRRRARRRANAHCRQRARLAA